MTEPKVPRPAKLPPHFEDFDRRMHDTVPPRAVRQAISEHDAKLADHTMAMAHALTGFQHSVTARFDRLDVEAAAVREQIAALHGYQITLREYLVRQTRIRAGLVLAGAIIGGIVATLGIK